MNHTYQDPVTGDTLTLSEHVSWLVQGVIRRWFFLVFVLLVTAFCWSTRNDTVLLWWNLSASLLAIIIETIVGLAMFGQTRRDATVLREVRAIASHVERIAEVLLKDVNAIEEQLEVREDDDDPEAQKVVDGWCSSDRIE